MNRFTSARDEEANRILQKGAKPYRARLFITIKSVTDVLSPAGKSIFVTLQTQHCTSQTKPKRIPHDAGERFELAETLQLVALFGRIGGEDLLKEQTLKNGSPITYFSPSMATIAIREEGINHKVRDYAVVNLVDFLYAMHSITDTHVDMKLGGCMSITVECMLESWKSEKPHNAISREANVSEESVEVEISQPLQKHIASREYGQVYKTTYAGGEWTEYPMIWEMQQPRKIQFWRIEGPHESDSESDGDLERVCDARYRVPRRTIRDSCKAGVPAKTGKMSPLQKYRVWAVEPFVDGDGETCALESLKERGSQAHVLSTEITYAEDDGVSDDDDDDEVVMSSTLDEHLAKRRISDCSDGMTETNEIMSL